MIAIEWSSNPMIAVYIAAGAVAAAIVTWAIMRKTVRSRIRTEREIRADTDINDWLIIFNWTRKVLYLPTMIVSLVAAAVMFFIGKDNNQAAEVVGGLWLAVFFLNYLVEEFEISVKIVVIIAVCTLALFLWLHLLGWVGDFLAGFGKISVAMSPVAYLMVFLLGLLAVGVAWIKGLFYYTVFTPNYMNIQWGPAESGDHIGREDYNTHVDTTDILERLMGFGRIVIIFKDQKRPPMTLLVWRIGRRAQLLEKVRGKFAIDMQGPRVPGLATAAEGPKAQSEPE
ncbi:MAG: hypothetical protein GWP05_04540 [Anaerolineaceae bacterium]|nr:hypothetical protein [Anaerolineaceae bacterium]